MAQGELPMFRDVRQFALALTDAAVTRGMDYELGCLFAFCISLVATALGNSLSETGYAPEFRTLGYWTMVGSVFFLGIGLIKRIFIYHPRKRLAKKSNQ